MTIIDKLNTALDEMADMQDEMCENDKIGRAHV